MTLGSLVEVEPDAVVELVCEFGLGGSEADETDMNEFLYIVGRIGTMAVDGRADGFFFFFFFLFYFFSFFFDAIGSA